MHTVKIKFEERPERSVDERYEVEVAILHELTHERVAVYYGVGRVPSEALMLASALWHSRHHNIR